MASNRPTLAKRLFGAASVGAVLLHAGVARAQPDDAAAQADALFQQAMQGILMDFRDSQIQR